MDTTETKTNLDVAKEFIMTDARWSAAKKLANHVQDVMGADDPLTIILTNAEEALFEESQKAEQAFDMLGLTSDEEGELFDQLKEETDGFHESVKQLFN